MLVGWFLYISALATAHSPVSIDWLTIIQTGGVVGMFVALSFMVLTRKIVPGWTYDAMEKDRDYYRDLINKSATLAERQISVAEALTSRLELEEASRLRAQYDSLKYRQERNDEPKR